MTTQAANVLLIDAAPETHTVLSHALASGEFAFFGARSVELGLRIASRRAPAVAVIDVSSASRPIDETVAALRETSPNMRVVLLTSQHVEPEARARLAALGPVLPKPFDVERLKDLIAHAVRLRGMSDGVERLRSRTGQFSIPPPSSKKKPSDSAPAPSSSPPSSSPPSSSPPSSSPASSRRE